MLYDISVLLYQATYSPVAPLRTYYALSARCILEMIKTMTKNTKHMREDCERINRDIVVCNPSSFLSAYSFLSTLPPPPPPYTRTHAHTHMHTCLSVSAYSFLSFRPFCIHSPRASFSKNMLWGRVSTLPLCRRFTLR